MGQLGVIGYRAYYLGERVGLKKTITYLGALLIFCLLVSLGFWQLSRMHEKERMEAAWERSLATPPTLWETQQPLPLAYSQIQLTGQLQADKTFLIDNQFHNQIAGYHVVTPLQLPDTGSYVLVNRGWIPKMAIATIPPCEADSLFGWVTYPDEKRFILGDNIIAQQPRLILQRIDFALLEQAWQTPVYPFMLLLADNASCGFVRDWSLKVMSAEKHLGYAVQWFALSLCFLILFIKFIYSREKS